METKPDTGKVLPANAFRELAPGETYAPVVPPNDPRPEISVTFSAVENPGRNIICQTS